MRLRLPISLSIRLPTSTSLVAIKRGLSPQHRDMCLIIAAFGALLLASSVIKGPNCHIQILYNGVLVCMSTVVSGVATLIGLLGLVALGLAIWGFVLVRRGQGGRGH